MRVMDTLTFSMTFLGDHVSLATALLLLHYYYYHYHHYLTFHTRRLPTTRSKDHISKMDFIILPIEYKFGWCYRFDLQVNRKIIGSLIS